MSSPGTAAAAKKPAPAGAASAGPLPRGIAPKLTREPGALGWPLGLTAGLIVAFLAVPVLFVIFYSFNKTAYFRFPPQGLSLRWYGNFFHLRSFLRGAWVSLALAAVVTPLAVAIGVAASYGLVRGRFKAAAVINGLLMSPIIIPGVVTGIALMTMFNLMGSGWSFGNLVIAMTLVCLPYTVRTISANLHGLNASTEEAAINLGASRWTTFRRVVLPQIRPGIVGGMIFVFATVLEDVSVVIFLTSYRTSTLSIAALGYLRNKDDPTIAAMATMLVAVTVGLVFIIQRVIGLEKFMTLE
jgi:putative spermidine/putrescine transport system permease protein